MKNMNILIAVSLILIFITSTVYAGNCLDNTKKIVVYLPVTDKVAHDPLFTSMFFEYNLAYLTDSTITSQLTKSNYDLLLVPSEEMSKTAAAAINKYLSNGGNVWFFADPRFNVGGSTSANRIVTLNGGSPTKIMIGNCSTITIDPSDSITSGLASTYTPVGSTEKSTYMRSFNPDSGIVSGFKYKVLVSTCWDGDMLIKFENNKTGAKCIYSNENMFISGGDCNYFDRATATKLFQQTKTWILGLDANKYGVSITYPKGDKQFTVTLDDMFAADWEIEDVQPFFEMEASKNLAAVKDMNTFFIVPGSDETTKSGIQYYSKYGDTHTIHPHDIADWTAPHSSKKFKKDIMKAERIMNKATVTSNYGFSSIRFPMVTANTNAYQAASDTGFAISTNYGWYTIHERIINNLSTNNGWYTGNVSIRYTTTNNFCFPKQKIVSGKESNLIELEIPGSFDISCENADEFYAQNVENLKYFYGVNFPSNYIIGGHIQGVMTSPDLFDNMSKLLDYVGENGEYTAFSTLDQLAKYNNLKNANIKAYNTAQGITIDIRTTKPIEDFTVKLTNIKNGVQAEYDGKPCNVIHADGVYYIFHTVSIGKHSITVSDL